MEFAVGFIIGLLLATLGGAFVYLKLKAQLIAASAELELLRSQVVQNESLSQNLTQDLSKQFEFIASKVFEEKSVRLNDQSMKSLTVLLDPFKERLKDFEKKVEDTYSTERADRGSLRGELSKLMDLNLRMSNETQSLTKALKGDVKTQGNWGELILENILDGSGLRKGEEYIIQGIDMSLKNDEGQMIKPDVIVNLPDNKHLIVDSKVSLVAYDGYVQAQTPEEQDRWAKVHIESLKKHIDGLSAKKYYSAEKLISPDFVILFMPLEPAFALAFKLKPDLLMYAWERKIALVSPTTLLTTLRTVATLWKQERQEKNALEIAKRGGQLYDKFVLLVSDLELVGKKIEDAQKTHQAVVNKLSSGQGNLIRQVEMLRELGAKTDKRLTWTGDLE